MTSFARAFGVVASGLFVALGALSACGSDTVQTSDAASGTGVAPQATFGDTDCATCVRDQCKAELTSCGGDPSCAAYETCVFGCPEQGGKVDEACAAACDEGSSTDAVKLAEGFSECRKKGLGATECPMCGTNPIAPPTADFLTNECPTPDPESACFTCEDTHCCGVEADCHDDAECADLQACIKACAGDSVCNDGCLAAHDAGVEPFARILACVTFYCTTECAAAPDACSRCTNTSDGACGELGAKARATHDGYLLNACVVGCPDSGCEQDCYAMYPDATDAYIQWAECFTVACSC